MNRKRFEVIYSGPGKAPWTCSAIPDELRELVKNKIISPPGEILEIGCGEGQQSIFFAKAGFNVLAIDQSKNAIRLAKQKTAAGKVGIKFMARQYRKLKPNKKFDFIFDWRFLHEITDETKRNDYIKMISGLLKSNGKYLSVAFSGDSDFMGHGKLRRSPVGIKIYFSTLKESERLVGKYLKILDSKLITVFQKPNLSIKANYILAQNNFDRAFHKKSKS